MKPTGKTFFVSERHKALHRSTVNLLLHTCSKAAALPCTFWLYLKPRLFEVSVLRPKTNMRFWDALSASPQAGCCTRCQSLWALWTTLSARLVLLLSSSLNSAARRERPALPALRVAAKGPAPRRGRPLVHVRWGVALRAPVQGR